MNRLADISGEKYLAALSAVALAVSCTWLCRQQPGIRRLRPQPVVAQLTGSTYVASGLQPREAPAVDWPKAPAQSHGSGWVYEVFTPPVIRYNALAGSFTVAPPAYPADVISPIGFELLAVKREPFRLQLVGYVGGPDDYLAAFTSSRHTDTFLARAGRRFDQLGLTLKSFAVTKVIGETIDMQPVHDVAGIAILFDDTTGVEVVLDSRTRKLTETPLAVIRLPNGDGQPHELHEGDLFSTDAGPYRIESIQLDPPGAVVVKQTSDLSGPEVHVLQVGDQLGARSGESPPMATDPL